MNLPIRTTLADVLAITKYLATKPTGASLPEAKRVLDSKFLDGRKLSAMKIWGMVSDDQGKLKLTARGRLAAKNGEEGLKSACAQVIQEIEAYKGIIEKAAHAGESTMSSTEVGSYWHEHFRESVSDNDKIINDQAVCFFQIVEGSKLGQSVVGRKGSPTRIEFNLQGFDFTETDAGEVGPPNTDSHPPKEEAETPMVESTRVRIQNFGNEATRVFISHGKNRSIIAPLKEIVTFGKFTPVVSMEQETTSIPVPEKVFRDMRSCFGGIIHVSAEEEFINSKGEKVKKLNDNVLIEIGAARALYEENVILLVEDGVELPSNLQGLYECRYKGANLDGEATIKLLKAFNSFKPLEEKSV